MMRLEELRSILQCPSCSGPLEDVTHCAACGSQFPVSGGQPVLIDFADSIFAREDYPEERETVQPSTGTPLGRALSRLTFGKSSVTRESVQRFVKELEGRKRKRVLVIGGGTLGSQTEVLYADQAIELIPTDIYPSRETLLVCDGHRLPFQDGSIDGVLIQAVLEHVLEPGRVVDEIHRVLAPDGLVLAETPFLQAVHMGAFDFTRFTFSGHRWLFRRFEEIDAGAVLGTGLTMLWSIRQGWLTLGLGEKAANLLTAPFFPVRALLERRLQQRPSLDGASGFFFLGRRSERSLVPRDMIAYYERSGSPQEG